MEVDVVDYLIVILFLIVAIVIGLTLSTLHIRIDGNEKRQAYHVMFPRLYFRVLPEDWIDLRRWNGSDEVAVKAIIEALYPGYEVRSNNGHYWAYRPYKKKLVVNVQHPYRVGSWKHIK